MKTCQFIVWVVAMWMLMSPVAAFAEVMEGVINSVDSVGSSLVMTEASTANGAVMQRHIAVAERAKFTGVNSLGDLHMGDKVRIDAAPNASGVLEATSIEKA